MYQSGSWGTICDEGWDKEDADVVCWQLGYPDAVSHKRLAEFGLGSGLIVITNVDCSGNENNLHDCMYSTQTTGCSHSEDAGVICRSKFKQILYVVYNLHFCVWN